MTDSPTLFEKLKESFGDRWASVEDRLGAFDIRALEQDFSTLDRPDVFDLFMSTNPEEQSNLNSGGHGLSKDEQELKDAERILPFAIGDFMRRFGSVLGEFALTVGSEKTAFDIDEQKAALGALSEGKLGEFLKRGLATKVEIVYAPTKVISTRATL